MTKNYQTPTIETYTGLETAFKHFNDRLFDNRLPPVLFTLTHRCAAPQRAAIPCARHEKQERTTT